MWTRRIGPGAQRYSPSADSIVGESGMDPVSSSSTRSAKTFSGVSIAPIGGPSSPLLSSRARPAEQISQSSCVMAACRFLLNLVVSVSASSLALSVAAFIAVIRADSSEACPSNIIARTCEFRYSGSIELKIVAGGWSKITSDSISLAWTFPCLTFSVLSLPSSELILKVSSSAFSMPVGDNGRIVRMLGSFVTRLMNLP
mmetsp:Transcript_1444/g.4206  ORF Transcript_1444/g.4206 Transcript_1444/m.4206 type:complete len:200 (+) Transcript_1444:51-650(+)